MSSLAGRLARFPRSVSSVAAATLLGATFLASPLAAQTPPVKPPAAAAATSTKAETLEQRITMLHSALKITSDQDARWTPVATAMRDNSAAMEKLVASKKSMTPENMTAVDDLKTYQEFGQAHLDGLKNLNSAFKSLYDSMPADQKKNADLVFQKYGAPSTPTQG
jgi:periplasmic protein CpxP/Spy